MNESEASLDLFLNSFHARDLAEPLASFDETTPAAAVLSAMTDRQFEFAGIRQSGFIVGWISRQDIRLDIPLSMRPYHDTIVVSDEDSLDVVVCRLNTAPCLFVRSLGHICGVISKREMHKPAMRMWLFGLVTLSELRVTKLIDELCPNDGWRSYLSEGRLRKAFDLQESRRQSGQHLELVDCLQFADKGRIVARDERLRAYTRFATKREVEDWVESLQELRNNLAHAHDVADNWAVILNLAANLHRIVLGPTPIAAQLDQRAE